MPIEIRLWLRSIVRRPARFAAAVASLAVGLGAVTAVYAVVDTTLITPLPSVSDPRVVAARRGAGRADGDWYTYRDFIALSGRRDLFEAIAAFGPLRPDQPIAANDFVTRGAALMVSAEYFDLLGVRAALGRGFVAADFLPDAHPTALLSYSFWRSRYAGSVAAIGTDIRVGDMVATIIGIAPPGFRGTDISRRPDVYLPLSVTPRVNPVDFDWLGDRGPMWLSVIGRLRSGMSPEAAAAALAAKEIDHAPAAKYLARTQLVGIQRAAVPARLWNHFSMLVSLFASAAGLVLLASSMTVGTLLVVQAEERRADLAICQAVGATTGRLLFEAWVTGLAPALAGTVMGLLIARLILTAAEQLMPQIDMPFNQFGAHVNVRVFIAVSLTALAASAIITLVTYRAMARTSAITVLPHGIGPHFIASRLARRVLSVTQVGSTMTLVVCTLLLVRSLHAVFSVDLGYQTEGLVEAVVDMTAARSTDDERRALFEDIASELTVALHAARVGQIGREWLVSVDMLMPTHSPGSRSRRRAPSIRVRTVSPDYLNVLGISLVEGRVFTESDTTDIGAAAVVSRTGARMLWPGSSPLGKRLGAAAGSGQPVVIGVVEDALSDPFDDLAPTVYVLWGSLPDYAMNSEFREVAQRIPKVVTFFVRTADLSAVKRVCAQHVRGWPAAAVNVRTTSERLQLAASYHRLTLVALGVLSGTALILAMLSIFILVRSAVVARLREVGIRIALGAQPLAVAGTLLRETLAVTIGGLVIGAVATTWARRLVERLLFRVDSSDLPSFAGAAAIMLVAMILAAAQPILRACRVDPAEVLREN